MTVTEELTITSSPLKKGQKLTVMDAYCIDKVCWGRIVSTFMVIVNAQTTTYVQILDLKAFTADVIYISHHQHSCIPEDADLHAGTQ
jgi:hypothetical protein